VQGQTYSALPVIKKLHALLKYQQQMPLPDMQQTLSSLEQQISPAGSGVRMQPQGDSAAAALVSTDAAHRSTVHAAMTAALAHAARDPAVVLSRNATAAVVAATEPKAARINLRPLRHLRQLSAGDISLPPRWRMPPLRFATPFTEDQALPLELVDPAADVAACPLLGAASALHLPSALPLAPLLVTLSALQNAAHMWLTKREALNARVPWRAAGAQQTQKHLQLSSGVLAAATLQSLLGLVTASARRALAAAVRVWPALGAYSPKRMQLADAAPAPLPPALLHGGAEASADWATLVGSAAALAQSHPSSQSNGVALEAYFLITRLVPLLLSVEALVPAAATLLNLGIAPETIQAAQAVASCNVSRDILVARPLYIPVTTEDAGRALTATVMLAAKDTVLALAAATRLLGQTLNRGVFAALALPFPTYGHLFEGGRDLTLVDKVAGAVALGGSKDGGIEDGSSEDGAAQATVTQALQGLAATTRRTLEFASTQLAARGAQHLAEVTVASAAAIGDSGVDVAQCASATLQAVLGAPATAAQHQQ